MPEFLPKFLVRWLTLHRHFYLCQLRLLGKWRISYCFAVIFRPHHRFKSNLKLMSGSIVCISFKSLSTQVKYTTNESLTIDVNQSLVKLAFRLLKVNWKMFKCYRNLKVIKGNSTPNKDMSTKFRMSF